MKQMRKIRNAAGLTLEQLADMVGTGNGHLSRVERGKAQPSYDLVERIARALGTTPAGLLGEIPVPGVPRTTAPGAMQGMAEPDLLPWTPPRKPPPPPRAPVEMQVQHDLWPFALLAGDRVLVELAEPPRDGNLCYVSTGDGTGAERGNVCRLAGDRLVAADGRVIPVGSENCVVRGRIVSVIRRHDP